MLCGCSYSREKPRDPSTARAMSNCIERSYDFRKRFRRISSRCYDSWPTQDMGLRASKKGCFVGSFCWIGIYLCSFDIEAQPIQTMGFSFF